MKTMTKKSQMMIATLLFSGFLSLFNETILNVALTKIMTDMHVEATTVQWLSTGYVLVVAIMVPTSAFFMEAVPIKKLFLGALSFFLAGSILASIAPIFSVLLSARMIQAIGTGLLAPIMINACLAVTPIESQGFTMSLCTGTILIGPTIGPIASGLILQFFHWRFLFYLMVPLAIVCIILGYLFVDLKEDRREVKLDVLSIIESASAFALLVYGMDIISNPAFSWIIKIAILSAGIVLLIIFCRRQLQLDMPMLDIRVFTKKIFTLGAALVILIQMVQFSMNILLPMIFESGLNLSSLAAAIALFPAVLGCSLMTLIVGKVYDKQGGSILIPLGLSVMVVAALVMSFVTKQTRLVFIVVVNVLLYLGIAFAWSPVQSSALASLSNEKKTHGVAVINTFIQLGSALGTPLFVGLMSSKKLVLLAQGKAETTSLYGGFSFSMQIAVVILSLGLIIAFLLSRVLSKKTQKSVQLRYKGHLKQ